MTRLTATVLLVSLGFASSITASDQPGRKLGPRVNTKQPSIKKITKFPSNLMISKTKRSQKAAPHSIDSNVKVNRSTVLWPPLTREEMEASPGFRAMHDQNNLRAKGDIAYELQDYNAALELYIKANNIVLPFPASEVDDGVDLDLYGSIADCLEHLSCPPSEMTPMYEKLMFEGSARASHYSKRISDSVNWKLYLEAMDRPDMPDYRTSTPTSWIKYASILAQTGRWRDAARAYNFALEVFSEENKKEPSLEYPKVKFDPEIVETSRLLGMANLFLVYTTVSTSGTVSYDKDYRYAQALKFAPYDPTINLFYAKHLADNIPPSDTEIKEVDEKNNSIRYYSKNFKEVEASAKAPLKYLNIAKGYGHGQVRAEAIEMKRKLEKLLTKREYVEYDDDNDSK